MDGICNCRSSFVGAIPTVMAAAVAAAVVVSVAQTGLAETEEPQQFSNRFNSS